MRILDPQGIACAEWVRADSIAFAGYLRIAHERASVHVLTHQNLSLSQYGGDFLRSAEGCGWIKRAEVKYDNGLKSRRFGKRCG